VAVLSLFLYLPAPTTTQSSLSIMPDEENEGLVEIL
jgi:hypothetical protein